LRRRQDSNLRPPAYQGEVTDLHATCEKND
jgi:hypothetical protein